ncbi:MAG: hypothetical protein KF861_22145, partial [Planctomycetaceae bacterium]|nr:hypothetical protein [Planctomycetaceae bacterium]
VLTFLDVGESGEKWTRAIQGLFILLAVITDTLVSRHHSKASRRLPQGGMTGGVQQGGPFV